MIAKESLTVSGWVSRLKKVKDWASSRVIRSEIQRASQMECLTAKVIHSGSGSMTAKVSCSACLMAFLKASLTGFGSVSLMEIERVSRWAIHSGFVKATVTVKPLLSGSVSVTVSLKAILKVFAMACRSETLTATHSLTAMASGWGFDSGSGLGCLTVIDSEIDWGSVKASRRVIR